MAFRYHQEAPLRTVVTSISQLDTRVADPHPFIADPDPHPFVADPDPSCHFHADPDPSFHFSADPRRPSDENLRPLVYRPSTVPF